jgi:hypothetical protein
VPIERAQTCNILDEDDAKKKIKLFVLPATFGKHSMKQYDIVAYRGIVTQKDLKENFDYLSSKDTPEKRYYLFELKSIE